MDENYKARKFGIQSAAQTDATRILRCGVVIFIVSFHLSCVVFNYTFLCVEHRKIESLR